MERQYLIGAITAVVFFTSAILVFLARMAGKPDLGKWVGLVQFLLVLPLLWLLIKAAGGEHGRLYFIQITAVLLWLVVEFLLDYALKLEFRQVRWMVIPYVMLFFAAAGGMVGLASNAGKGWSLFAIILFIITAILAFLQRRLTGY